MNFTAEFLKVELYEVSSSFGSTEHFGHNLSDAISARALAFIWFLIEVEFIYTLTRLDHFLFISSHFPRRVISLSESSFLLHMQPCSYFSFPFILDSIAVVKISFLPEFYWNKCSPWCSFFFPFSKWSIYMFSPLPLHPEQLICGCSNSISISALLWEPL